jgi:hypothetical protein
MPRPEAADASAQRMIVLADPLGDAFFGPFYELRNSVTCSIIQT